MVIKSKKLQVLMGAVEIVTHWSGATEKRRLGTTAIQQSIKMLLRLKRIFPDERIKCSFPEASEQYFTLFLLSYLQKAI